MIVPHRTPFLLPLLFPSSLLWRFPTSRPELWLTFDDGPVPGPTEFVLDTLAQFGVLATFFCIGDNVRKHRDIYQRIIAEGHAVGNHTFNHLNGWKADDAAYLRNIRECEDELGDSASGLFRPPYGRIRRSQIRLLSAYRIVMWDVLTQDYDRSISPSLCLQGSLKAARAGSIIVFHDSLKAEKNLHFVLPRFIEESLKNGFSFKKFESHGQRSGYTA